MNMERSCKRGAYSFSSLIPLAQLSGLQEPFGVREIKILLDD
jgi:hypothetical protein